MEDLPSSCIFSFRFLHFFTYVLKKHEKCPKRQFWPENGIQSTSLLVKIHNKHGSVWISDKDAVHEFKALTGKSLQSGRAHCQMCCLQTTLSLAVGKMERKVMFNKKLFKKLNDNYTRGNYFPLVLRFPWHGQRWIHPTFSVKGERPF